MKTSLLQALALIVALPIVLAGPLAGPAVVCRLFGRIGVRC
jgi:hypothetical protein